MVDQDTARTGSSQATRRAGIFLLVVAMTVFIDFLSKQMVVAWLSEYRGGLTVMPFFSLRLVFNSGISFGLLPAVSTGAVLTLLAVAAVITVALTWLGLRTAFRVERLGYGLIVGGALGNMIDRALDGVVTDFLDFSIFGWHWPTFNLADTAITGGLLLLLANSSRW